MADQLTSVRFPARRLEQLKLLADLHDGSVAQEIRTAVDAYVARVTSAPDFEERLRAKQDEQLRQARELADSLLAGG